jgi:endonuclease III related protein
VHDDVAQYRLRPADAHGFSVRQPAEWLLSAYRVLNEHFGDLHWWPGDSPLEIIVGAILTQNTAWRNVEQSIRALKGHQMLTVSRMLDVEDRVLAGCIRPSGYYNVKTARLKAFFSFLQKNYGGSLEEMFGEETWPLRRRLLSVHGIGEETADSILLYAGRKPVFVVDAYTRRILNRHGMIPEKANYSIIQALFMHHLPCDVSLWNQYHALIVETGKRFCRKNPLCHACPLEHFQDLAPA